MALDPTSTDPGATEPVRPPPRRLRRLLPILVPGGVFLVSGASLVLYILTGARRLDDDHPRRAVHGGARGG